MSNLRVLDPAFTDSFDSALRRFFAPVALETDAPALKMRVDVSEKGNAYLVKADIPGVKKEDINVRIDGKILRSERYWGNISRTFSLAQDVDDSKVVAKYADGVLTLELPKKASSAARKVTVQ